MVGRHIVKTKVFYFHTLVYAAGGIPLIGFFVYYWSKGVGVLDRVNKQRLVFLKTDSDKNQR